MFAVSLPSDANGKKKSPSIIDMMNAAYSMTPSSGVGSAAAAAATATATAIEHQLGSRSGAYNTKRRSNNMMSTTLDERLDAARAMLGISPSSVTDGNVECIMGGRGRANVKQSKEYDALESSQSSGENPVEGNIVDTNASSGALGARRHRSDSAGLEALAFLATQEVEASPTTAATKATTVQTTAPYSTVSLVANPAIMSSDDDSEIMPPPPPRTTVTRRRRSISNPEGMNKWGLPMTTGDYEDSKSQTMRRLRLVLPVSILEEEMAEADAAVIAKEKSTASASALAASLLSQRKGVHRPSSIPARSQLALIEEDEDEEEEKLDHDEMLRHARSRLLEDLSQSSLSGEKGVLTLPHSLAKYKDVYNKNGRIGIYTPSERAAIIARFQSKRTRRVWNKKIRYNCRKNLADRRLRVKGRFVKRSVTTTASGKETFKGSCIATAAASEKTTDKGGISSTGAGSSVPSILEDLEVDQGEKDTDMPDVSDPDAGFCPTDESPYRRLRRHTIT